MLEILSDSKIPRRQVLRTGAGVLFVATIFPSQALAHAPDIGLQRAQEDWITKPIITDTPFITENGTPRLPSMIGTEPVQIPPGSPARFRLLMACEPIEEGVAMTASGGFVVATGQFDEYGPMTTNWLAISWFRRAYGIVQDQGEGPKDGRRLTDDGGPLPELLLTINPEGTFADAEGPEIQRTQKDYPLLRSIFGDANSERVLYLGAYSSSKVRNTIHALDLLTRQ